MNDINSLLSSAKDATKDILCLQENDINNLLIALADETDKRFDEIIEANKKDLERMDSTDPKYDRLLLNENRIKAIAQDIRNVASLKSPVDEITEQIVRPNGLVIKKKRVPFGVIGIIYEARPNVSFDVFSLCFKTSNVSILKGSADAAYSNEAIVNIIHSVLESHGINKNVCTLLPPNREATAELLQARDYVDLVIPRGSSSLINYVRENSKIPVIETGAGICHTYFDKSGDVEKGKNIVNNAKTRRVSVCNALDCLIIHKDRLSDLPQIVSLLENSNVEIFADKRAYEALDGNYPSNLLKLADEHSFGTEFLSYKMSIKTVDDINEALGHISKYSSKHSEAIIAEDKNVTNLFNRFVDAACVYSNASTSFTDGGQFGFGAEIGISTQKLHARGPMALKEITTYKYIIEGDGQIRNN
ncbi:MAG: glutamate-5-semialdehyde dehydrogenase [Bacteroidales bacterium]|nr:glutamate-5-semialdehyde dehydrogenase [Bacteroidales bacterium]